MTTTALVPGSLGAVAKRDGMGIAESFLSADTLAVIDVSGSMADRDSRNGQSRYDTACLELARLQAELPGKIGVVAFSSWTEFVPGGQPPFIGGGTDLAGALRFVQPADGTVSFIIISDGWPDEPDKALTIARTFKSKISTIYTGPESDRHGADFLRALAAASGGKHITADRAQELAERAKTLMLGAPNR